MTAAGDAVEEPGAIDHLIALGYVDPLETAARRDREQRAEAAELNRAQAWIDAGQFPRAVSLLQQLASEAPNRTAPRRSLAHAYFHANQLSEARQTLRALELDGVEGADLALLAAAIASRQRLFDEALEQAEYARCLRQPLPGADILIGEIHRRRGDLALAEAAFQRASQHDSARAAAYVGLAAISQGRGDHADAVEQLLAALEADMTDWTAHYRLGLSLIRLGRPSEAKVALQACTKLQPTLGGPWRLLAQAGANCGDQSKAEQCRERGRLTVRQRRLARTTAGAASSPSDASLRRPASP